MADKRENQMSIVSNIDYVRGLKGEDSVLIAPGNLPHPNTGGGYVESWVNEGKWYRIAVGPRGEFPSSGLFNIGNNFAYDSAKGILLYAFTDAYSGGSTVVKLASTPALPISQARVLSSESLSSYLDVYVRLKNKNILYISAAALIGFKLQVPTEVSADIPEGYSVNEFSF